MSNVGTTPEPTRFSAPLVSPSALQRYERIRLEAGIEQPALKAERIQEFLESHPRWVPTQNGPGLTRGYRFPTAGDAAAFSVFVADLLAGLGLTAKLSIVGPLVALEISTGREPGTVTALDFEIAAAVEGRED
jgi:pterin-4a-carbinolamine dehydratase